MRDTIVRKLVLVSLLVPTTYARGEESLEKKIRSAPIAEAVLRTEGPLVDMRINADKTAMAFVDQRGQSLRIMDLNTQEVVEVTPHRVGEAFFWSPDSTRLFFRELIRDKDKISSTLKAFDTVLQKTVTLDTYEGSTGYLTLDPRDYTFYMVHEKGIMSRRLDFPGERFARWQQRAKKTIDQGRFVATQKSVLWLSDLGLTMVDLPDDGSGVESFDISPDGSTIAWATNKAQIFTSHLGETPKNLGPGRDPRWHETRSLLLYSGGRVVGNKVYDYDVRISDLNGNGRYLTNTPSIKERWPQWWTEGTALYTREGTTDLWRLPYRENTEMSAKSETSTTVNQ